MKFEENFNGTINTRVSVDMNILLYEIQPKTLH